MILSSEQDCIILVLLFDPLGVFISNHLKWLGGNVLHHSSTRKGTSAGAGPYNILHSSESFRENTNVKGRRSFVP